MVVDPGDAAPVLDYLEREGLALDAILITHHHADHVGGMAEILERFKVPVFGPAGEPIPTLTRAVTAGDRVAIEPFGLSFEVLDIPGHTRAHIAYYGANMVFCGDTLFACGCGRVFEGTPAQMLTSLSRLAALPDDTRVYCGHEYTLANIRFARAVDPGNAVLQRAKPRIAPCATPIAPRCPRPSAAKRRPIRFCAASSPRSQRRPTSTAAARRRPGRSVRRHPRLEEQGVIRGAKTRREMPKKAHPKSVENSPTC